MNIGVVLFTKISAGAGIEQVAVNLARSIESVSGSDSVYIFQTDFIGNLQKEHSFALKTLVRTEIVSIRSPYNRRIWKFARKYPHLKFFYTNIIYPILYIVMNHKTIKFYAKKLDYIIFLWYRDVIPWKLVSSEVFEKSVASGDCGLVDPKRNLLSRILGTFVLHCTKKFRYLNPNQIRLHLTSSNQELYLPNGVDTTIFKILPDSKRETKNYIFVGRLVKEKGLPELIAAVKSLKYEDWLNISIAGSGEYEHEISVLSSNQKNVEYLGFLEPEQLSELYGNSDVLILPSYGESFGNVVIEAVSSGVFCMVSESLRGNFDDLERIGALKYIINTESGIREAILKTRNIKIPTETKIIWHKYIQVNYSWTSVAERLLLFLNKSQLKCS